MILGYFALGTSFILRVLGYCSHNNGDACNGEVACCIDEHTIAKCPIPVYEDSGHWEVSECGGLINRCLDDGSSAGADCD